MSLKAPDEVEKYVQSNSSDNYTHPYNVEILNLFDPKLQLKDTESAIKKQIKEIFK